MTRYILACLVAVVVLVIAGCGGGKSEATGDTRAKDRHGWSCEEGTLKYGLCPRNPYFGKKPAEVRTARAQKRKAAQKRHAANAKAELAATHWAGEDYYYFTDEIAYKWANRRNCDYSFYEACWAMNVRTRYGCDSLYVELQIQDRRRNAVDWTNGTASHLAPRQLAKLTFESFKGGAHWAHVAEMSC